METKQCRSCNKNKSPCSFYKGHARCKECYKKVVVDYKKTKKGKIVITYKDMKARVLGQTGRGHQYFGLPICKKEEFYDFCFNDPIFNKLFEKWENSGYDEFYKPSIDREIPEKGYVLSNIRWVTTKDNICKNIDPDKYKLNEDGDLPF